jgi:hypothetical protein
MLNVAATPNEEAVNADMVASIAEETHQPLPVVKQIYEEQYSRLKSDARLLDYLALFATRRTKEILAEQPSTDEAGARRATV